MFSPNPADIDREVAQGVRTQFRSRAQILQQKAEKLGKHPNTWFLKGKVQNTLKCQVTPQSKLVEALRKTLGDEMGAEGGATKVVELGGDLVTSGLSGPVRPTGQPGCVFPKPCNVDQETDCTRPRVVYRVDCLNCRDATGDQASYIGTSGFSLHKRQMEHLGEIRRGQQSNSMAKHHKLSHRGLDPQFQSTILRGGIQYNLDRYILEAYNIEQTKQNPNVVLLNQRGEWGNRGLPRLETRASP